MITVVGVGIQKGDITARGKKAVRNATAVFSRVRTYFKTEALAKTITATSYDDVDTAICERLLASERDGERVVFCVAGDGYCDSAVAKLAEKTQVEIIPGVSEYRGRTPGGRIKQMAACEVTGAAYIDSDAPLLVYGINDEMEAGEIKRELAAYFGDEEKVVFSNKLGTTEIPLYELDRQKKYDGACAFLPLSDGLMEKKRFGFYDLIFIMKKLTSNDGCPWDKAQTHESIRINMLEEAYEAVEAIDSGDTENLIEELGDVILQSVFHCDMARREGEFDIGDVISALCEKLVFRHTHIFGKDKALDADSALVLWEAAKAKEKKYSSLSEQLERIPVVFPASLRAEKYLKKTNKSGADISATALKAKLRELLDGEVNADNAGKMLLLAHFLATASGVDGEVELGEQAEKFKTDAESAEKNGELSSLADRL